MKESERKKKFNEFVKISQEGILGSSATAKKLGISINTLYNWRKRMRAEDNRLSATASQHSLSIPSFSKVAVNGNHTVTPTVEITIANTIVMRIPSQVLSDVLPAILNNVAIRGKLK
jgi:transposase-like protein